jgi:hypothetical protein
VYAQADTHVARMYIGSAVWQAVGPNPDQAELKSRIATRAMEMCSPGIGYVFHDVHTGYCMKCVQWYPKRSPENGTMGTVGVIRQAEPERSSTSTSTTCRAIKSSFSALS